MKFAFIILQYKCPEQTLLCAHSILNSCTEAEGKFSITIVDNGSGDDSFEIVQSEFRKSSIVNVIKSDVNLGFAKGLNLGIDTIQKKDNPDFYILLNSDTEIEHKNWQYEIKEAYSRTDFSVAGPDIILLDRTSHCNPRKKRTYNKKTVHSMLLKSQIDLFFLKYIGINLNAMKRKAINSILPSSNKNTPQTYAVDVELQGSCLILSKNYIMHHNGLYPETFLYCEESILKFICDRDGMKTVYIPQIQILHKEGVSTNNIFSSDRKKEIFIMENVVSSREKMYKLVCNPELFPDKNAE